MLRKQAGLSQEQLARALDQRARASPPEEYRVVDGTLISRWERACVRAGRRWHPTRHYVLLLIDLFATQLTYESAQTWARQAGYVLAAKELERWFTPIVEAPRGEKALVFERNHEIRPITHNLPAPLSSFMGRRNELAILVDFLTRPRTRLVTIVGEGGVGKTRLALAVGHTLLEMQTSLSDSERFVDGIWFVPLAGVEMADPADLVNQLVFAVASVFSLPFQRMDSTPLAVLIDFLRSKRLLLILDNFEHLLDGASFVLDLLANAPSVFILVTSRAPLDCQAEQLLVLEGLPVPLNGETDALDFASIQLFVERANQQDPHFAVDRRTLHQIGELAALVHGNPLAMELAARWIRHLSIAELAAAFRHEDGILLSTRQQDVPLRHRSMEAVFEASWRLLSLEAQQALAKLTVFRGAFSRQAALAITQDAVDQLQELVNHSLLHIVQVSTGRKKYVLHELLRQFAALKLAAPEKIQPGLEADIRRRHSDYYLDLAAKHVDALYSRNMNLVAEEMQAEFDNFRAAWEWAMQEHSVSTITQAIPGLQAFYHVRSLYQEGEAVFDRAAAVLSTTAVSSSEAARVILELQLARAFFLNLLHRYKDAAEVAHKVLQACEEQNAASLTAVAQVEWGIAISLQGWHDAARQQLEKAAQSAHQLGLPLVEARALHAMFRCLLPVGEIEQAGSVLEQALLLYQRIGNRLGESFVLRSLGYVAHFQNEEKKALYFWERAVSIYQELGDQPRLISIWQHLGDAHAALGDLGRAYQYYDAAYTRREDVHDPRHAAHTADGFARLLIRLGRFAQARQLCQQALAELRRLGDQVGAIEALCTLAMAELQLGNAAAALVCLQEALELSRVSSAQVYEGSIVFGIGCALAAMNRCDKALDLYRQALNSHHAQGQYLAIVIKSEMAAVYLSQGRNADALALINEVLPLLNPSAFPKLRDPLRVWFICYQVLQANHVANAASYLTEAHAHLQAWAQSLDDDRLRASLLHQVAVNRAIERAYRKQTD
ncbi:MAG TPA: tetratricopeptide repeat protein [Chloroflexi bacterium]|nr:tetratricopeptide repeat protein [Chloroflexota bacterium]